MPSEFRMTQTAKLFSNGRSQAVRLPAAYRHPAPLASDNSGNRGASKDQRYLRKSSLRPGLRPSGLAGDGSHVAAGNAVDPVGARTIEPPLPDRTQ